MVSLQRPPAGQGSYRIAITTDANYRAVCNGVLVSHQARSSRETWVYEQSEPMASYLATVQIGRYELLPSTLTGPQGTSPSWPPCRRSCPPRPAPGSPASRR